MQIVTTVIPNITALLTLQGTNQYTMAILAEINELGWQLVISSEPASEPDHRHKSSTPIG